MRLLRVVGILALSFFGMVLVATAGKNNLGVSDVVTVTFATPVRVGATLLPAGQYTVRHTMEGQTHVMVFQRAQSRDEFKVTCTLVPLSQKAREDQTIYELNAANERVLQSLVFRGDTAKHVF